MIKPCRFDQATNFLPATVIEDGKKTDISFHHYQDGKISIACFEIPKEELDKIAETGKLWVVVPFKSFPPITLTSVSPFTPKIQTLNENQNIESPSNNGEHHNGDNKLSIERGSLGKPD